MWRTHAPTTQQNIATDALLRSHIHQHTLDHARHVGLTLQPTLRTSATYVLGVTSPGPAEGKSTLSRALADVLAADWNCSVVVVDLHAERPSLPPSADTRYPRVGLVNWARNECTLEEAVIAHDGWTLLPSGTPAATSRDLLHALTRHAALDRLRRCYNVVLLDLPDLGNGAGAALATMCDGVVLVAHAGKTPADHLQAAVSVLNSVTLHGVVLNRYRAATPHVLRRLWA